MNANTAGKRNSDVETPKIPKQLMKKWLTNHGIL